MVGANGISALISFLRTLVFQVAAILVLPIVWGLNGIWLSVVAKDISPYYIAVGNPCKVIKKRFDVITYKKEGIKMQKVCHRRVLTGIYQLMENYS